VVSPGLAGIASAAFRGLRRPAAKIIWALLDLAAIAVLASGVYLWLGKRKSSRAVTEVRAQPAVAATSGIGS